MMNATKLEKIRLSFPVRGLQDRYKFLAQTNHTGLVNDLFPEFSVQDVYMPVVSALSKPWVPIQIRRIMVRDLAADYHVRYLGSHTFEGSTPDARVDEITTALGGIFFGKAQTVRDAATTLLSFGYILATDAAWKGGMNPQNSQQAWRSMELWGSTLTKFVTQVDEAAHKADDPNHIRSGAS